MSGIEEIKKQLAAYKKKYYQMQLFAGSLLFLIINGSTFFAFSSLEHSFWLGPNGRALLFFSFLIILLGSAYQLIVRPVLQILNISRGISDAEAAKDITKFFPEIEDRLINTLQLSLQQTNAFLEAAIQNKTSQLTPYSFTQAVDFQRVKRFSAVLSIVFLALALISFISPSLLTDSSKRIVNFNKEFHPIAPFSIEILNPKLEAFRGDDFTLTIKVSGAQVPEAINLLVEGNQQKKIWLERPLVTYKFAKIQKNQTLQFEAAGFSFGPYQIRVRERPELISMDIEVQEPRHTGGKTRQVTNTADLVVLEGSTVKWKIKTLATDSIQFNINKTPVSSRALRSNQFVLTRRVYESGSYNMNLFNAYGTNRSALNYSIEVIKDEYPKILTEFFLDSISYSSLGMGGSISDDYGIRTLQINYKKEDEKGFNRIPLQINTDLKVQGFYANWNLDSLQLADGATLELYLSVRDNDEINGPKESRSQTYIFRSPSREEIEALIAGSEENVESGLKESEEAAKNIAERLQEIEERLKAEQAFNWQEKKMLTEVLQDKEKLNKQIEELQKEHQKLQNSSQQFQERSEQLQEKNNMLQEILEQLLDEETRELYDKLKELLEKEASPEEISSQTEQLRKREESLEKDLERAAELFKRLKMESALEQNLQQLDSILQKQEDAAKLSGEESENTQEEVNKEFDAFRDKMDEVEQMNQELKKPEPLQDFELEEKQIAKDQREALEELRKEQKEAEENNSDASDNQENEEENEQKPGSSPAKQKQQQAAQKMKDLGKKLTKMQGGMQMEMMQANLDDLRDILDNLIKLSFNQEKIMQEMREVNQSDPRFLTLSQNQLKLKDDARVIQDSLLSLAEKVVQISSFVTREVEEVNKNIDESLSFLKDRNRNRAITSQQFSMTSMNNLALLLDETLQNMQMAMAEASGQSSKKDQKPSGLPDLQELQNALGEKINQLKESSKAGRELSEELARLAAEQELIRRQMDRLKEAQDGKPGGGLGGKEMKQAIELMEQNEIDLVNKRLTQQLIRRQQQIQTRLLEAEKAQRNQEMDEEREARSAKIISREMPPEFEEYLKLKKKEIELLKSIPLELNPFYKKEVNDYFRRLSTEKQE